jgi:hypothetical protein
MGDGCRRMRAAKPCAFAEASPDTLRCFANIDRIWPALPKLRRMVPREGIIRNHRRDEPLFVLSMVA